jgi:hypothetical protein
MIKLLSPKSALVLASKVYALWIVSLAITTMILESGFLGHTGIEILVIAIALICGPGCALLWVAQGKYQVDCTAPCPEHKGLYSSIFYIFMCASQIFSSFLNVYLIDLVPSYEFLFVVCVFISIGATIMMLTLLPP